jgi:hypothetical protein
MDRQIEKLKERNRLAYIGLCNLINNETE